MCYDPLRFCLCSSICSPRSVLCSLPIPSAAQRCTGWAFFFGVLSAAPPSALDLLSPVQRFSVPSRVPPSGAWDVLFSRPGTFLLFTFLTSLPRIALWFEAHPEYRSAVREVGFLERSLCPCSRFLGSLPQTALWLPIPSTAQRCAGYSFLGVPCSSRPRTFLLCLTSLPRIALWFEAPLPLSGARSGLFWSVLSAPLLPSPSALLSLSLSFLLSFSDRKSVV